jgi:hypothetical protein
MAKNTTQPVPSLWENEIITESTGIINNEEFGDRRLSNLEITGIGNLQIRNTGGSSASEGGMGTGGGAEKGPGITDPGGKKEKQDADSNIKDAEAETWDPLKPKEEKAKGKG